MFLYATRAAWRGRLQIRLYNVCANAHRSILSMLSPTMREIFQGDATCAELKMLDISTNGLVILEKLIYGNYNEVIDIKEDGKLTQDLILLCSKYGFPAQEALAWSFPVEDTAKWCKQCVQTGRMDLTKELCERYSEMSTKHLIVSISKKPEEIQKRLEECDHDFIKALCYFEENDDNYQGMTNKQFMVWAWATKMGICDARKILKRELGNSVQGGYEEFGLNEHHGIYSSDLQAKVVPKLRLISKVFDKPFGIWLTNQRALTNEINHLISRTQSSFGGMSELIVEPLQLLKLFLRYPEALDF